MEAKNIAIKCPLHPKESIKRIDLEFGAEKELYCIECLVSVDNPVQLGARLKPLEDFIEMAARYYNENFKKTQEDHETPDEYIEVLGKQSENLETLAKHIEDEKKKVQLKFDDITKELLKMITAKRDEYFHLLDQQLFNYRYGYIFYEKQLRKAFPKAEDASLYPSKEELLTKLSKLQNSTQLMAFVKNVKEDLNESKLYETQDGLTADEARRFLIKNLTKKLEEIKSKSPTLIDPDGDVTKAKEALEKALAKMWDGLFNLNNEIEDIATGDSFPRSVLLKSTDFSMIKKWLDKEYQNRKFKLLYRGTKDGMNATTFHNLCNNKGPTVSVMKSKHGKVFGGFMPDAWTSRNNYINTRNSWVYSITAKAKYTMNDPNTYAQYGGYDYYTYGPTYGGGHDIYLATDFTSNSNYCNRHSYNFPDNTTLTGGYNFQLEEIEVYSIDKK
jgi:hypothetical protein